MSAGLARPYRRYADVMDSVGWGSPRRRRPGFRRCCGLRGRRPAKAGPTGSAVAMGFVQGGAASDVGNFDVAADFDDVARPSPALQVLWSSWILYKGGARPANSADP